MGVRKRQNQMWGKNTPASPTATPARRLPGEMVSGEGMK
jgi:hypothetical protein